MNDHFSGWTCVSRYQNVSVLDFIGANVDGDDGDNWHFACTLPGVVSTTSIILSCNEIQNGDIPVPANPGPPGKMAVKMERKVLCLFPSVVSTGLVTEMTRALHVL